MLTSLFYVTGECHMFVHQGSSEPLTVLIKQPGNDHIDVTFLIRKKHLYLKKIYKLLLVTYRIHPNDQTSTSKLCPFLLSTSGAM